MKKAQWKQDPRERAFGKDPREVLNQKLTERVQDLEEKIAYLKQRTAAMQDNWDGQRENFLRRIKEMQPKASAYNVLRNNGVVLACEEEFKHLKGEDMDAFFGIEPPPKVSPHLWEHAMTAANSRTGRTATGSSLQQQVSNQFSAEFGRVFAETILTGTGVTKWPQPQK